MDLAPIILFVYNRPAHTQQTLSSLMRNELADQSKLYIFCDGLKENSSEKDIEALQETRRCIREKQWCKEIIIYENEKNKGLALSIVEGVTQIIDIHGKAIILEDDMATSVHFLNYMNDGLNYFKENNAIGSINSYAERFLEKTNFPHYFLLNGSDCWGWGTWKNRWDDYNMDAKDLKNRIISADKIQAFEYGNHMQLLEDQIKGLVNTWDIQWHAINILLNRKGLYPKYSFIQNTGLDGSGTHCEPMPGFNDGLQLNQYHPTLSEYLSENELFYKKNIDETYKRLYKSKFKVSLVKSLFFFYKRLSNKYNQFFRKNNKFK